MMSASLTVASLTHDVGVFDTFHRPLGTCIARRLDLPQDFIRSFLGIPGGLKLSKDVT